MTDLSTEWQIVLAVAAAVTSLQYTSGYKMPPKIKKVMSHPVFYYIGMMSMIYGVMSSQGLPQIMMALFLWLFIDIYSLILKYSKSDPKYHRYIALTLVCISTLIFLYYYAVDMETSLLYLILIVQVFSKVNYVKPHPRRSVFLTEDRWFIYLSIASTLYLKFNTIQNKSIFYSVWLVFTGAFLGWDALSQ